MLVDPKFFLDLSQGIPYHRFAYAVADSGTVKDSSRRNDKLKAMVAASLEASESVDRCVTKLLAYDQTYHIPPLFSDQTEPQMQGADVQSNALRFVASNLKSINQKRKAKGLPPQEFVLKVENAQAQQVATKPQKLMFVSASTIFDAPLHIDFLIKDVLENNTLHSLTGPPGAGKTFVAIDFSCCIATGHPWNGKEVKRGAVLYLAGEGRSGVKRRVNAWATHYGYKRTDLHELYLSSGTIEIVDDCVAEITAEMKGKNIKLIVVDTLARHIEGDENVARDMTKFVGLVDQLRDAFGGCTAVIVHHTGRSNTDRSRGSSSYTAALDSEILVKNQRLEWIKMKEAEPPVTIDFQLEQVTIGTDSETGTPITSAVPIYGTTNRPSTRDLTPPQHIALEALSRASAEKKDDSDDIGTAGLKENEWREMFYKMTKSVKPDATPESLKKAFQRATGDLLNTGLVKRDGGYYCASP